MATPIKPNIGIKADYIARPSVPSGQKENSTEFNLIVEAIRANFERLILDWTTDIPVNTTLLVGQYVLFTGVVYRIITSYNVGSPLTWDGAKAVAIGGGGTADTIYTADGTLAGGRQVDADGFNLSFINVALLQFLVDTFSVVAQTSIDITSIIDMLLTANGSFILNANGGDIVVTIDAAGIKLESGGSTAVIDLDGQKIINLLDPTSAQDAATKSYVDAAALGIISSWKEPVKVATTIAGTLATSFENGDTIDGVALTTNMRILIKNQVAGEENGIYIVNASGAPTRATDANTSSELEGVAVMVQQGTANANSTWIQTADSITLGTTPLVWAQPTPPVTFATIAEINTGTEASKPIAPDQLQGSKYITQSLAKIFCVASGTNTYTGTFTPANTALVAGQMFLVQFTNASTSTTPTFNPDGLGAKTIVKRNSSALVSGDIAAGQFYTLVYDGTNMRIMGIANYGILEGLTVNDLTASLFVKTDSNKKLVTIGSASQSDMITGTDDTKPATALSSESKRSVKLTTFSNNATGSSTIDCGSKQEVTVVYTTTVTGAITIALSNDSNLEVLHIVIPITGSSIGITTPSTTRMARYEEVSAGDGWYESTKILQVSSVGTADTHELSFKRVSSGPTFNLRYNGPARA